MISLRNVVLAGHADSGKTTLAEHLLHSDRRHQPAGQGRRRTASARLRARGAEAQAVAVAGRGDDGPQRHRDHHHRHARLCRLRGRGRRGLRGGRCARSSRWTPRAASRPARSGPIALGRCAWHRRHVRHHPLRARERGPDRCAGRPARRRSATRSRHSTWPSAGRTRSRAMSTSSIARRTCGEGGKRAEAAMPAELADEVAHAPRPAAGGGRRGGRRRSDQVPRGRGDQRRRARGLPPQAACATRSWRRSWSSRRARDIGIDGPARRDHALPPLPRRGEAGQGDRWRGQGGRGGAVGRRAARWRRCSRRRPTRSSAG